MGDLLSVLATYHIELGLPLVILSLPTGLLARLEQQNLSSCCCRLSLIESHRTVDVRTNEEFNGRMRLSKLDHSRVRPEQSISLAQRRTSNLVTLLKIRNTA